MKRLNDATPEEWDSAHAAMYKKKEEAELTYEEWKAAQHSSSSRSDGSSATYYKLPANATQLQDLISHKNMNGQVAEIFRECYRYNEASHCNELRGAKKMRFYIDAEIARLEKKYAIDNN